MIIKAIAAINSWGYIGKDNQLMYRIPEDLSAFKAETLSCALIMGRKTYESLPKILSGRAHVVVTTKSEDQIKHPEGREREVVTFVESPEKALSVAKKLAYLRDSDVCVIGGESIYRSLADHVDDLLLTRISHLLVGDAIFPAAKYARHFSNMHQGKWRKCPKTTLHFQFVLGRKSDEY